jgi:hypothetical protein
MMIRTASFSRAALFAGLFAFAALPALAQSLQPSVPALGAGAGVKATVSTPSAQAGVNARADAAINKKQQAKAPAPSDKAGAKSSVGGGATIDR